MAATTQITVTKSWSKIADGNCTMQSVTNSDFYDVAVGSAVPTTDAYLTLKLSEPVNFAFEEAVYCRLSDSSKRDSAIINIIK